MFRGTVSRNGEDNLYFNPEKDLSPSPPLPPPDFRVNNLVNEDQSEINENHQTLYHQPSVSPLSPTFNSQQFHPSQQSRFNMSSPQFHLHQNPPCHSLQSQLDTSLSPPFHLQQNSQSLRSQYSVSSPAFRTPLHQLMYNDQHVADSESQPASTNNVVIEPPAQNENASGKSKNK